MKSSFLPKYERKIVRISALQYIGQKGKGNSSSKELGEETSEMANKEIAELKRSGVVLEMNPGETSPTYIVRIPYGTFIKHDQDIRGGDNVV